MTFRLALRLLGSAASLACAGAAPRASAQASPADSFAAVIRTLVADSSMRGAGRAERPVTAADAVTARLLEEAGVPVASHVQGEDLLCPGSTLATGAPPRGPRGYYLRVETKPDARTPTDSTVHVVHLTYSCRFMYRGEFSRGGVFATTEFWEVHVRDGRWRIARLLGRAIT